MGCKTPGGKEDPMKDLEYHNRNYRICSKHFEDNQFMNTEEKSFLVCNRPANPTNDDKPAKVCKVTYV